MVRNTAAIKLLVEALRSNTYKQGIGWLNMGNCYCVWGVACDVFIRAGGKLTVENDPEAHIALGKRVNLVRYNGKSATPPSIVQEWLGIRFDDGLYSGLGVWSLAGLNDQRVQFPLLADIIESNYLKEV